VSDQQKQIEFELVRRAQNGDEKAFEQLVVLHDRHVLKVAYSMTGSLVDAQDVYQETFLRAFKSIQSFRFASSFRTWLLRIAVNQSINWRKKRKRRAFFSLNSTNDGDEKSQLDFIVGSLDSSTSVHSEEILKQIQAGLTTLSHKERAVFTLRHFQDIKLKEIATTMNCAEGTVKNLLFRATQKMQKALKEYIED